ncbi:hypothetical protein KC349_g73 [Hortaea werneckii]|nr:hypothetical protein KC349_g73 [Hortaea werneckii]
MCDLEHCAQDTTSGLRDIDQIGHQSQSLQFQSANVGLKQYVDLTVWLIDGFLDRNRHPLQQLRQFQLLILTDRNILELLAQCEDSEELNGSVPGRRPVFLSRRAFVQVFHRRHNLRQPGISQVSESCARIDICWFIRDK